MGEIEIIHKGRKADLLSSSKKRKKIKERESKKL